MIDSKNCREGVKKEAGEARRCAEEQLAKIQKGATLVMPCFAQSLNGQTNVLLAAVAAGQRGQGELGAETRLRKGQRGDGVLNPNQKSPQNFLSSPEQREWVDVAVDAWQGSG